MVEDRAYVGNSGDSRAVMSLNFGSKVQDLSNDHKPNAPTEKTRVESAGGGIYK